MDRLTTIESAFKDVLLEIDSTITTPAGYTYLNDVTIVNLEDEGLVLDRGDYPSINIYLDPEETVLSGEQRAYRNIARFKLVCNVALDILEPNPRFQINTQMNTLLNDVKAVLSLNYHLNDTCDRASIKKSNRTYNTNTNNNLRVGELIVWVEVLYTQSRLNPSLNACV